MTLSHVTSILFEPDHPFLFSHAQLKHVHRAVSPTRSFHQPPHLLPALTHPQLLALSSHIEAFEQQLSRAVWIMTAPNPSISFFFSPLLPPSSSRHQPIPPQRSSGMQGCIPGLMKLIMQESRPERSLNQHHKKTKKNKQKAVCSSGEPHEITEAFNVFVKQER